MEIARVDPCPKFRCGLHTQNGLTFGVIELPISLDGPFLASKDHAHVKAKRLYYRRGSMNAEATTTEQKNIYRWFHGTGAPSETPSRSGRRRPHEQRPPPPSMS